MNNYIKDVAEKFAKQHAEKIESLTEKQFTDVLIGLISSGDITRHVQYAHFHLSKDGELSKDVKQGLSYVPFRDKLELQHQLTQKDKQIELLLECVSELIEATEYGVNQWQKAYSPESETNGQKAIKTARETLEKYREMNGTKYN